MKTELLHFYKKVKAENVVVVGTPQFEPYVLDRYKTTREAFCFKFNLDADKKTICFSCGDISTSRNDELYITTIAEAIEENKIQKVNLMVRTSPARVLVGATLREWTPTMSVALKSCVARRVRSMDETLWVVR